MARGEHDRRKVPLVLMFTDIEGSTHLVSELGDDAWASLLSWHDELLRAEFRASGGTEVRHLGDGFFAVFPEAGPAIECAIRIQRRLARQTGRDALRVRIGVHRSDVLRHGSGYLGRGVHEAARIAALAKGGEIVVSAATIAAATVPVSVPTSHRVTLRGFPEPLDIVRLGPRRAQTRPRVGAGGRPCSYGASAPARRHSLVPA